MNFKNPQTPGVYIQELNAFPNSIVEVATAIPAFIGYTQRADYNGQSLKGTAVKVTSLNDFTTYFGGGLGSKLQFTLSAASSDLPNVHDPLKPILTLNKIQYQLAISSTTYYLYNSIRLFYQNGGGTCYIIPLGLYSGGAIALADFQSGLSTLDNEQDPTIIVFPDGLSLSKSDYASLMQAAIKNASSAQNKVAIFDVWGGAVADPNLCQPIIDNFRNDVGADNLNYGAAYFPWLQTSIIQNGEVTFANFGTLTNYLETDFPDTITTDLIAPANVAVAADPYMTDTKTQLAVTLAHNAMMSASRNYKNLILWASNIANVLPASPAMAGIYTYVDSMLGVWKAPANVSLTAVVAPTINLNDTQQGDFNVDAVSGKSINVIRSFTGQGVLVWGARTLDGNSQDWRYINVRRTMIMIEQSVKLAARAYVFEPNTANTWASVKSMIGNFLNGLWKQGAFAGAKPEDAYSIAVGLGSTMTGDDILNGKMNITVLVAVSHPAEFIMITFQQQMQKS